MKSLKTLFWIGIIVSSFVVAGCAGSKPKAEPESSTTTQKDEYDEIEQLLGITPEEQQTAAPEQNQDDLLELLTKENQTSTQSQAVKSAATPSVQPKQTGQEVDQLNKKLQEKDKTIALLRSQVMAMEENQSAPGKSAVYISGQPNMTDEEYEINYQHGYNLAINKQYKDAIQVFETLLAANTKHSLSDNAQYWIGECYYALGDYRAAILAFEKVFTFKQSNKNDYAQYKLGLCYYQLKDRQRAREEFQSLVDNYSNPSLTGKAEEYLAKL